MPKVDIPQRLEGLRGFPPQGSVSAFEGYITGDLDQLPDEWVKRYQQDSQNPDGRLAYTVLSYKTPIAWVVLDKETDGPLAVVIPKVRYSKTTDKAQSWCRKYIPFLKYRVEEV